ncbi:MAG: type II toxin-antitoxin system VapC family toxin [Treponema sp.]|nr:MAG: type II toxin-antitoxin system VapC family toxin [Treponema sp.]
MKYLLDTNALIFSLCNPNELSKSARKIITLERELFVSVVSFWEIAIKQSIGKLAIESDIPRIEEICKERGIQVISILSEEIEGIKKLPKFHNDPFDRIIISQALQNDFCIITRDTIIPKYPVKTLW